MTWESFYLICFLFGFLMTLIAFLAQSGHLHAGHGHFHGHGGHGGHAGHGESGGMLSKLNFSTITTFLAWFGGTGYILRRYTSAWYLVALGAAAAIGLAGAVLMFWVLSKLISRDRPLDPADFDMIGVLGRVTSTVRPDGVGEIVFTQDGARKASPVRSEDGTRIERDVEVVVTKYERGVAYVRRWDELAGN